MHGRVRIVLSCVTLVQAQVTVTVPDVDPHAPVGRPEPNVVVESLKAAGTHRGITAWWVGNSGFAVQIGDKVVLTDPVIELARDSDPLGSEMGYRKAGPGGMAATRVAMR